MRSEIVETIRSSWIALEIGDGLFGARLWNEAKQAAQTAGLDWDSIVQEAKNNKETQ